MFCKMLFLRVKIIVKFLKKLTLKDYMKDSPKTIKSNELFLHLNGRNVKWRWSSKYRQHNSLVLPI